MGTLPGESPKVPGLFPQHFDSPGSSSGGAIQWFLPLSIPDLPVTSETGNTGGFTL